MDVPAYWFSSGTPSFLIRLLETRGWGIAGLEGSVARALEFDAPAERLTLPLPMLYQGGYLTIKGYNPRRDAYTLGIQIETEFKTATGRVGAVIRTDSTVFVLEFKYGKSAEAALAQIDDKGYMLPFARDARKLCKVDVNFSGELRTIDSWIVERAWVALGRALQCGRVARGRLPTSSAACGTERRHRLGGCRDCRGPAESGCCGSPAQ